MHDNQAEACHIDSLEQAQEVGKLKAEVHLINGTLNKLFQKFDDFVEKVTPKPTTLGTILAGLLALLTIFALLFGTVIYIANSSNAPVIAQLAQMNNNIQTLSGSTIQNNSLIQLTNQKLSGIDNKVLSNVETLRWLIFDENIPKKITKCQDKIQTLEQEVAKLREIYYSKRSNNDSP